jgi:hypothetical protein
MNNPDYISESLETIFWVEILKSCDSEIGDRKNLDSEFRDGKKSDPG